jgi:uncharacterized phage protein gp47/JayE
MPWSTPTLQQVRMLVRDSVQGTLPGADASIPNSVLRVTSDVQGALCHLTLQYVDWLALQLLPDTAEHEWLDRHGWIWLVNADGTTGRKLATLAQGSATFTGTLDAAVPQATNLTAGGITYETTEQIFIGSVPTAATIRAIDTGSAGNQDVGTVMSVVNAPVGVDSSAIVVSLTGGTDDETDDELRARVLKRIREPPMGGDKTDYEQWALAVPGVTRAWCSPLEMGMGTVTLRFMMDDLRADNGGFPVQIDINAVSAYLNTVRPVAVKDIFIVVPIPQRCDVHINLLNPDTSDVRAAIEVSLENMFFEMQAPGQTIYAAWKSFAIMNTPGVVSFDLTNNSDDIMQSPGNIGVLGDIFYAQTQ